MTEDLLAATERAGERAQCSGVNWHHLISIISDAKNAHAAAATASKIGCFTICLSTTTATANRQS